jgi:hypothetical protein
MAANPITQPSWQPLVADAHGAPQTIAIPARPDGLWTKVVDCIPAGHKLRIQVMGGQWTADPDKASSGAEGVMRDATGLLAPWAPPGCLIGKVGGSTADNTAPLATATVAQTQAVNAPTVFVFAVGSFCMVQVPTAVTGPLYLTMNDAPANFSKHAGSVNVQAFGAQ